jgi:hypothetical protein
MRLNRTTLLSFPIRAKRCQYSRYTRSTRGIYVVVLALCFASASFLLPAQSFAQEGDGGASSGEHNQKNEDCPPGTRGPFSTCREYWEAINKEALRLGYQDGNKDRGPNGTADFLENYTRRVHDCADVAAEVACVSNQSECIEQVAKQYRSNSANHSDNYVEGIGECDFTPFTSNEPNKGQAGGGLADNYDTTIDDGAPDPGENVDPAYTCAMNGANRRSVGGGGMAGAASNMAMMMALSQLLNGMNGGMSGENEDLNGSGQDQGTPPPGPTPTPIAVATPTCTPIPTAGRTLPTPVAPKIASGNGLSDDSNSFGSESKGNTSSKPKAKPLDAGFFSDLPPEGSTAKRRGTNPAWSEFSGDMFDSKDVL